MAIHLGRFYRAHKQEGAKIGGIGIALGVIFSTYAHLTTPQPKKINFSMDLNNSTDPSIMCYSDETLAANNALASLMPADYFNYTAQPAIPDFEIPAEGELYPLNEIERIALEQKYAKFGLEPEYQTILITSDDQFAFDYQSPKALAEARERFTRYIEKNRTIHGVTIPFEALEGTFIAQELTQMNGYASLIIAVPESQNDGSLDLRARNRGTNARGMYQFIPSTGLQRIAQTAGTDLAPLFPEADEIKSFRRTNADGIIIDAYYVPKDATKGYSRSNRDFTREKEILDAVYYNTTRASIMMAMNLKANIDYYQANVPAEHVLTVNDAHSTHFRGAGRAIKFFWRMQNEPDAMAYTLYERRDDDGSITETGKNSLEVRKNLPVYNTSVKRVNGTPTPFGEWRTHAQVHDYYVAKGMTLDPLKVHSANHSVEIVPTMIENNTDIIADSTKSEENNVIVNPIEINTYALRLTPSGV